MIPLFIKPGVSLLGLHPQIVVAILSAMPIWERYGASDLTITSCTEGQHSRGSRHYIGYAVDLRTNTLPGGTQGGAAASCAQDLKTALTHEFDVVHEASHIHVEYDPER